MSFIKKLQRRRGVAIIATIFVVAIVLTLSVSFLTVTLNESKSTQTDEESTMALQLAKAGCELVLNYMSSVDQNPPAGTYQSVWRRGTGDYPVILNIYEEENPNNYRNFQFYVTIPNEGDFSTADSDTGYIDDVFPEEVGLDLPGHVYQLDIRPDGILDAPKGSYVGRISCRLRQVKYLANQPEQFILESTGQVFRTNVAGDNTIGENQPPVAARTVEMRYRQRSPLDNLQFFQNHRAFDMVGNGVAPPNNTDGSDNAVGIPQGYQAQGSVVIDGNSAFATDTAGNMNFFSMEDVNFYGQVSINQGSNIYPEGTEQGDIWNMFNGGMISNQASLGLPNRDNYMNADPTGSGNVTAGERGSAADIALESEGTMMDIDGDGTQESCVKAFFRVGDNDGFDASPGDIGHCAAMDDPVAIASWEANGADIAGDQLLQDISADVEFDGMMLNSKPGFAKFYVEMKEQGGRGLVTVKKVSAYTRQEYTYYENVDVRLIKDGVLYFEGGNVEVKGDLKGRLTVVSAEHPTREAYKYEIKTQSGKTIEQFSDQKYNEQLIRDGHLPEGCEVPGKVTLDPGDKILSVKQIYRDGTSGEYSGNANNIYVSYDDERLPLRVDPDTGNLTGAFDRVPPYKTADGKWIWPGESTILNTLKNENNMGIFRDIEREGNVTLGADIDYGDSVSALGIIAKNYILINDDNVTENNPTINIRAVLMSFDHSVQFDDVNLSAKDEWISKPDMNGTINFRGSMISQYSDVEGKTDGTGYTIQNFQWDPNLRNVLPPNFPLWDAVQIGNGPNAGSIVMNYVILSYQDVAGMKPSMEPQN